MQEEKAVPTAEERVDSVSSSPEEETAQAVPTQEVPATDAQAQAEAEDTGKNQGSLQGSDRKQKRITKLLEKKRKAEELIARIAGDGSSELEEVFNNTQPEYRYNQEGNEEIEMTLEQIREEARRQAREEVRSELKNEKARETYQAQVDAWKQDIEDTIKAHPELDPESPQFDPEFEELVSTIFEKANSVYDPINDREYTMPRFKLSEIVVSQKKLIGKYGEKTAQEKLKQSTERLSQIAGETAVFPSSHGNSVDLGELAKNKWENAEKIYEELKKRLG